MEHIIKQLKKAATHTRLSVTEKTDMRNALLRHVKANPVSNEVLARHHKTKAHAILSPLQINNLRNKKTMPILVILGLLMGGSASFAAETTVPGDVLYPVKVHVNESVRGVVAVSPAAKAEWEVKLVERRLEEVKKLATTPNVAPEAQAQAQQNLVTYTHHVEDRIAKFEEDEDGEDAIKTSSNLSNVLAAYEQLLAALAAAQPASTATTATNTATTTPTTTATSTATSTPVAASSTPATTLTPANIEALREILSKLNEVQNDAEEKHKELKKKYHKEEKENNKEEDGDEDEDEHTQWTPAPVVPPVATTPGTATSTATTTPATTSTSTATTTPVVASSTSNTHFEKHEEENHREEIRGTAGTSTTATSTQRVSRERTESRNSHNDND